MFGKSELHECDKNTINLTSNLKQNRQKAQNAGRRNSSFFRE